MKRRRLTLRRPGMASPVQGADSGDLVSDFAEIAVGDGERLSALLYLDRVNAEHAAKPVLGHLHRARPRRGTGCWHWKGGGAGGVERYCAFHLLHDLVNVAVEHCY
jgi:hypothetical protein